VAALITASFLKQNVLTTIRESYESNNPRGVQVADFLDDGAYKKMLRSVGTLKLKKTEVRDTHSFFAAGGKGLAFFKSSEFLSFVSAVTGRVLTSADVSVRMFMHGNYTLMHDDAETDGVEFYFDMTPTWEASLGGYTAFLSEEGEKLIVQPAPNTLLLARSGRSYVKYVNCRAGGEGRLVVCGLLR
jgi:Rps23 Pro-64 3,4-dihydroxylase Tpa1-like proline 4-hydroxylase